MGPSHLGAQGYVVQEWLGFLALHRRYDFFRSSALTPFSL